MSHRQTLSHLMFFDALHGSAQSIYVHSSSCQWKTLAEVRRITNASGPSQQTFDKVLQRLRFAAAL